MAGYSYTATIVRVIDGDTVVVTLDLGFRIYQKHALRLAGLNAPELSTPEGKAAKAFALQWFADHGMHGFIVHTEKNPEDKYGRYLANVYADGLWLNEDLITNGHAVRWDGKGPKP